MRGTALAVSHRIEINCLRLWNILRNGTIWAANTFRRWDTFSEAVSVEALAGFVRRRVVNVAFLGEVDHAKDHFSILRLSEVDILSDNRVYQVVIRVTFSNKLWC